jgi:hypothetical protein
MTRELAHVCVVNIPVDDVRDNVAALLLSQRVCFRAYEIEIVASRFKEQRNVFNRRRRGQTLFNRAIDFVPNRTTSTTSIIAIAAAPIVLSTYPTTTTARLDCAVHRNQICTRYSIAVAGYSCRRMLFDSRGPIHASSKTAGVG